MKKRFLCVLLCVVMMFTLAACGGKKVNGYYIGSSSEDIALEINGDEAVLYVYDSRSSQLIYVTAAVEKADDGVDFYFNGDATGGYDQLQKYSPLHFALSESGDRAYMDSDSSGWSTDTFDKVSKKEFEDLLEKWRSEEKDTKSENDDNAIDDNYTPVSSSEDNIEEPEVPQIPPLSDEECEFRAMFIDSVFNMLDSHRYGEEITDEYIDNLIGFSEEDPNSVVPEMIKEYFPQMVEEFDKLDEAGQQEIFNTDIYSPEVETILSVNLTDLYNEYEARKIEYTQQYNAAKEQAEHAYTVIEAPETPDNVIYNENGITLTYVGAEFSEDHHFMTLKVHVLNQNPDNKKAIVSFNSNSVALNGLQLATSSSTRAEILAGEETDLTLDGCALENYIEGLSYLGETTDTLPIETISFVYEIKVGSDGEQETRIAELKTTKFSEGDLNNLFGTLVAQGIEESADIGIYVKTGDFGVTATAVNNRRENLSWESPYAKYIDILANGNEFSRLMSENIKSSITYCAPSSANINPGQATILCCLNITPEMIQELRRQFEIGNDVPIEITINYLKDYLGQNIPAVIYSE